MNIIVIIFIILIINYFNYLISHFVSFSSSQIFSNIAIYLLLSDENLLQNHRIYTKYIIN